MGKSSDNYKRLRNRVQEECSKCKKRFYENKVSGLQDSNISRWWKDIKDLGGLSVSGDWSSQLIGSDIPDKATLALKFNEFLGSLTAHFRPLEPLLPVFGPVPMHLYVSECTVYKTLRALKVKKSSGPEQIPKRVCFWTFSCACWFIQLLTWTGLCSSTTETRCCGPCPEVPPPKICWKWPKASVINFTKSQSTGRLHS